MYILISTVFHSLCIAFTCYCTSVKWIFNIACVCLCRAELEQVTLEKQHLEETVKSLRARCCDMEEQCVQHGRMHQRMKDRWANTACTYCTVHTTGAARPCFWHIIHLFKRKTTKKCPVILSMCVFSHMNRNLWRSCEIYKKKDKLSWQSVSNQSAVLSTSNVDFYLFIYFLMRIVLIFVDTSLSVSCCLLPQAAQSNCSLIVKDSNFFLPLIK